MTLFLAFLAVYNSYLKFKIIFKSVLCASSIIYISIVSYMNVCDGRVWFVGDFFYYSCFRKINLRKRVNCSCKRNIAYHKQTKQKKKHSTFIFIVECVKLKGMHFPKSAWTALFFPLFYLNSNLLVWSLK